MKKTLYFPGKTLYYSYQVCGSLDAFTAQACMKKDDENACADPCAYRIARLRAPGDFGDGAGGRGLVGRVMARPAALLRPRVSVACRRRWRVE